MKLSDRIDNMETDEINLLNFPDEILLEIFHNLGDNSLLQAIGVCRKFKYLTEMSFRKRYNGTSKENFFSLKIAGKSFAEEYEQYQPLFLHFGHNVKAINIDFRDNVVVINHWLISLIQCYCNSITKLRISHGKGVDLVRFIRLMPNLAQLSLENVQFLNHEWTAYTYPQLVHFSGRNSEGDQDAFTTFVRLNPQLENISLIRFIRRTNNILCTMNGTLKNLKNLELIGDNVSFAKTERFSPMDNLRIFTVRVDEQSFRPLLATIRGGLKNIEKLTIYIWSHFDLTIDDIKMLCSFNTLKELELQNGFRLSIELIKTLIAHLPNLSIFSLSDGRDLYRAVDDILNVVYVCRRLSQLEIDVKDAPALNYDFCKRFADLMEINDCNLKLMLTFDEGDKMIFTRDEAHQCLHDMLFDEVMQHRSLYWKGYDAACSSSNRNLLDLSDNILNKIVSYLDGDALAALFQTCHQGRKLTIAYLNEATFRSAVCPLKPRSKLTSGSVLTILGQYIRRIDIDLDVDYYIIVYDDDQDENDEATETHQLKIRFIKSVNRWCGNVLTEMKITGTIPIKAVLHWPSLKRLHLGCVPVEILQFFNCPELTHLIISPEAGTIIGSGNYMDPFPNLTSLTFEHYNDSVEALLCNLNRRFYTQMKDLYIQGTFKTNPYRQWLKLTNIIIRFSRLATLHLHIGGIEQSNFKFLFENCPMLVESTISASKLRSSVDIETLLKIVRTIKRSCSNIKIIRLVVDRSNYISISDLQKMVPETTFH